MKQHEEKLIHKNKVDSGHHLIGSEFTAFKDRQLQSKKNFSMLFRANKRKTSKR